MDTGRSISVTSVRQVINRLINLSVHLATLDASSAFRQAASGFLRLDSKGFRYRAKWSSIPRVGEDRTEGAQQGKDYLTVGEAAKLLGVHRNTIHYRIKTGRIKAHKVVEDDNEVYRIERDSIDVGRTSADVRTLDAQRTTASEELSRMIATRLDQIVRDYTHNLGDLREELGAERARREIAEATLREGMAEEQRRREDAERERDDLRRELYSLRRATEASETVEVEPERAEPQPAASGPQTFNGLSVWGYGLGIILTGMTGFLMQLGLGYQIFQRLGLGFPNDVVFRYGAGWGLPLLLPIIFGYQVGRKPRGDNFWRHVGVTALLAALVSFLPWAILVVPQTGTGLLTSNEVATIFFKATQMWLPVGLAFLSSALIGNARRHRVAGLTP
jgi:excisionase family DNA binding protein